jgi:hypothetical protein
MQNLSVNIDMAWRIAAHEAAASGYWCIEKEHLLIGIVSIEKVIADGQNQTGFDRDVWQDLRR